jgi:hypothetical protein
MTRLYALSEASDEANPPMPTTRTGAADPNPVEAFVRIRLAGQAVPQVFEAWLLCRTAVRGLWSLAGDFDYEVHLVCAAPHDLAAEVHAIRRSGAEHTDTCLLLHQVMAE